MAVDKTKGRLKRNYRITWVDDGGMSGYQVNPPISPQRLSHLVVNRFAGTQVDAVVCTVGTVAGYTTSYPTEVDGMDFIVDRFEAGAKLGNTQIWRGAENLRTLWAAGHDPVQLSLDESKRLGIDFWLQLRMNDWHHVGESGEAVRLISSNWYEQHPEYLIGSDGAAGWPAPLADSLQWFQDFAHDPVRQMRLAVATEAVDRYDVDGWEYDFVRCPGLFRYGQERANAGLITDLIRETRLMLDDAERRRGRQIGFAVRVPNTIEGCRMLGLDVVQWIEEELVDIVVPCAFFAQDMEEDATPWVVAAADTTVRIHQGMDEGYQTGAILGLGVPYYQVPSQIMQGLTPEMVRGLAARHWRAGVDGIYLFNGPGTLGTYGVDNREVLDQVGAPRSLQYRDKRYALTRGTNSFPNCYPQEYLLPTRLGPDPAVFSIAVADDVVGAGARIDHVHLELLLQDLCHLDRLHVTLNGKELPCLNPLEAGGLAPDERTWLVYDLAEALPKQGKNEVTVSVKRAERLAEEMPLVLSDLELAICHKYPHGAFREPPGYLPRT